MKTLILFNLKRRFFNRMTLLINAVLFLVILFLFHGDYFLGNKQTERKFCIDDSMKEYRSAFMALERKYQVSNHEIGEQDVLIHYDGRFTIICASPLEESLLEDIRSDIRQVVRETYCRQYPALRHLAQQYLDIQVSITQNEKPESGVWLVGTVVYFLLMNYSSTIASEAVFEKSNHLLEGIITSLPARRHLIAKIIQGYLTVLIQLLLVILFAAVGFAARWLEDGFSGLRQFIERNDLFPASVISLNVSWSQLLVIGAIMISGLMIVQTAMLLVCSRLSSSEQAAGLQGLFYVLLLVGYYLLLMNGENWISEGRYVELLSCLPVVSVYLMSCLLILRRATLIQGLLALGINVITLLLLVETGSGRYRRNLMRF